MSRGIDFTPKIVKISLHRTSFKNLKSYIIPDNEIGGEFLRKYSRVYGEGQKHGFQYIRGINDLGYEHYFSSDIFHLFKVK